jgi:hypothetical protein
MNRYKIVILDPAGLVSSYEVIADGIINACRAFPQSGVTLPTGTILSVTMILE